MENTSLDPVLKRWLAVHNVQVPVPAKVWGRVKPFVKDGFRWTTAMGEEFPPQSIVRSGSQFELSLHPSKEAEWLRRGAIAPLDAGLHFNLEDVFGEDYAKYLRLSNVWTFEDILANKMGDVLVGNNLIKISAANMVRQLSQNKPDVVAAWMEDVRAIVEGARVAVAPAPPARKAKKATEVAAE